MPRVLNIEFPNVFGSILRVSILFYWSMYSCSLFIFLSFFCSMWNMLKYFIKFVTILLLFYVSVFWPRGDLSSPTKGQTYTVCIGRWSLNYWTSKEVPIQSFHTVLIILVQSPSRVLMDWSVPNSSVLHYLPEFAQIHIHWVIDAI